MIVSEEKRTHSQGSLIQKTLQGMMWMFWGAGTYAALKVAVLAALARILAPQDFGTVAAAALVIVFGEIFSQMGIGPSLVQRKDLTEKCLGTALTLSLLLGFLFGLAVYLAAPLIAAFYRVPEVLQVSRILALCFPLRAASVIAESLIRRTLDFRKIAMADIVAYAIGYGMGSVVMALCGFGLWSIVFGILLHSAIRTVILVSLQRHPWGLALSHAELKGLVRMGGGFTLSNLFNVFALYGDNLVVGRCLGPTMLGLYTRSYNLMAVSVTLFGNVVTSVLFPAMSSVHGDDELLRQAFLRSVSFVNTVMLPCSIVAFVLAPEIILTLLGPEWKEAILPFRVLSVGMYFRVGYKISATLLQSRGEVFGYASREGLYALLVVGGTLMGQRWGLWGVSVAVLVALASHFTVLSWAGMARLDVKFGEFLHLHVQGLSLGLFFGLLAWGISRALSGLMLPSPAILFPTVAFLAALAGVLLFRLPIVIAGRNNLWLVEMFQNMIANGNPRLRRFTGCGIRKA